MCKCPHFDEKSKRAENIDVEFGGQKACSFLCAPVRAIVVGQATALSLLGAGYSSAGWLERQSKVKKHVSWHMFCASSFEILWMGWSGQWDCGVERGCGLWVDAGEHCTCAVNFLVHMYSSLSFVSS